MIMAGITLAALVSLPFLFLWFAVHNVRRNDATCAFLAENKIIMGTRGYLEVHRPDGGVVPLRSPRPKRSVDWSLVSVYTIGICSVPSIELIAHRVGPMTAGMAVVLVLVLIAAPGGRLAERLPAAKVVQKAPRLESRIAA
jgi:hypothetical protein